MNNKKQMTISKELYIKYKDMQKQCHNKLLELEKKHNAELELMKKYQSARLGNDQAVVAKELNRIKIEIAINAAVSNILRQFLLEIALENTTYEIKNFAEVEDKANENC